MSDELVTITTKEYNELIEDSRKLCYLIGAGVDNWEGYEYAMQALNEEDV